MSKHHKIQFKKKKLNTYTNRYSVSLSSLYHLLRHWGSIHPNNRHCQQLASSFLPQPLVLFLMINSKLCLSNVKKNIIKMCPRSKHLKVYQYKFRKQVLFCIQLYLWLSRYCSFWIKNFNFHIFYLWNSTSSNSFHW